MGFDVEPDAIGEYSGTLEGLYTDLWYAKRYTQVHGDFHFDQLGIMGKLAGAHEPFIEQLNQTFEQLRTILSQSADSLAATAEQYDRTDRDAAARVDASYPLSPRTASRD